MRPGRAAAPEIETVVRKVGLEDVVSYAQDLLGTCSQSSRTSLALAPEPVWICCCNSHLVGLAAEFAAQQPLVGSSLIQSLSELGLDGELNLHLRAARLRCYHCALLVSACWMRYRSRHPGRPSEPFLVMRC